MQRDIRRKDRVLETPLAQALLENGEYGVLSTCGGDGQPYGVPVNYAVMGTDIVIHCATAGHKVENIAENPKVSFTVVGKTELLPEKFATRYESVIAFGRASFIDDPNLKRDGLRALVAKYAADHIKAGDDYIETLIDKTRVIRVAVDRITGKARR
ncbi:MAG: pyridoxamine 5'-phosphate oxidase family protein [Pseudomonadota bacterium]